VLEAYAVCCDVDDEVASLAMLAALAVAKRVGLSEEAIDMMKQSAVAEARKQCRRGGKPHRSDAGA
jgi:hypothetical protein